MKGDPTRTQTARRKFEGSINRRFSILSTRINEVINRQDGFGLKVNRGHFEFERSADKVTAFMEWLAQAQREEILEVSQGTPINQAANGHWSNIYIQTGYVRGLNQAASHLRKGGAVVEQRWVDAAFRRPIHADRLGLAYTRVFTELKGITEAMDQQISRELALGLAGGDGPPAIAKRITDRVAKIGRTRARMLARTEVIAAHADATLNAYEEAGIQGVEVIAEWLTAVDACPICTALEAKSPYRLSEARGLIPVHPNCRCAWAPIVVDGTGIELR